MKTSDNLFYPYKVLVVNAGSSSIKFQVFNIISQDNFKLISRGDAQGIAAKKSYFTHIVYDKSYHSETFFPNHKATIDFILEQLVKTKLINNLNEIKLIGHRFVHGGKYFPKPTIVDHTFVDKLTEIKDMAPLHTPGQLITIKALLKTTDVVNVAVFDTSFHQTMPQINYLYPVPYSWYSDYSIRKYGFHGISYEFLVGKVSQILKIDNNKLNGIICHLGNGSSVAAIKNGISFDTSMGFTPLGGIMSGTRCGDIDPSILQYMNQQTGKTLSEITHDLNFNSGLYGMSQVTYDVRTIEEMYLKGHKQAKLAVELYSKIVADHIAKYYNSLGGKIDYLAFSAGIGENSKVIVETILEKIKGLGFVQNYEVPNERRWKDETGYHFLGETANVKTFLLKTNEELMICKTAIKLALAASKK